MRIGAGPRLILYLYSNLVSRVFVFPKFGGCSRFCVEAKVAFFSYEKVTHYTSVAVDFSINIESGP